MSLQINCIACDQYPGSVTLQNSVLVSKMFQEVTGLKIKQHYTICKACQLELRNCYNFRQRCHEVFNLYNSALSMDHSDPLTGNQMLVIPKREPTEPVIMEENYRGSDEDNDDYGYNDDFNDEDYTEKKVKKKRTNDSGSGYKMQYRECDRMIISDYLINSEGKKKTGICIACNKTVQWAAERVASHLRTSCPNVSEEIKRKFAKRKFTGYFEPNNTDSGSGSLTDDMRKDIDLKVANFFFRTGVPSRVVESDAFKELIKSLNPNYAVAMPNVESIDSENNEMPASDS